MKLQFPKNFYWGAATASYQVEGGIDNCDWAKAGREGKVPVAGRSGDHYNRYEEDFKLAKELGHNAHRFSIEWARIEPKEGEFNKEEIEHYRKVLKSLREKGLEPFVTLWHFTIPQWFADKGGFENKNSPEVFSRYCEYVVKEIGELADFWTTMNEPNVLSSNGWVRGNWPPFKKCPRKHLRVLNNLVKAHKLSFQKIKEIRPSINVSIVKDNIAFLPKWNPVALFLRWHWNRRFLNKTKGYFDSIGLNYYFYKKFGENKNYEKTDMGWDIVPIGIRDVLLELKRYKKPIFIAENGLADADDSRREKFIVDHLTEVHKAIEDGVDVFGFMYWSLLDNFEWALGYEKRFGLIEINYDSLERIVRPSAYRYKKICEENQLELF